MRDWLARGFECQCASTDGYHDKNVSVMEYGDHSIRMCWHHQHKYREQTSPMLNKLAEKNVADFVVYRARAHFMFDESHQLKLPELCWWAWVKEVIDLIPEEVAAASLRVASHSVPAGVKKESDIEHTPAARQIVAEKAKKAAKTLVIDPAPPKALFKIPKRERWTSEKFTRWVKSQPCACCGAPSDDPHHIMVMDREAWVPRRTIFLPFRFAENITMICILTCHGGRQYTETKLNYGLDLLIILYL